MSQLQNNENVITVRRLMRALSSLWDKFTAALSTKADSQTVTSALSTKADSQTVTAALSTKADQSDFQDLQGFTNRLNSAATAAIARLETVENRPLPRVEVQMRMTKQRMIIICRKGELLSSDVPVFMRNVRTVNNFRKRTAEGKKFFGTVVKGWKRPLWFEKTHDGIISRERVPLYMELLNGRNDLEEFAESGMSYLPLMLGKTNMYDFWEIVYSGYWIDDGGLALIMFNENGNSLLGTKQDDGQINDGSFSIHLQGKQLGIVITRNGLPITDIMSFRMQTDSYGDPIFGKWR